MSKRMKRSLRVGLIAAGAGLGLVAGGILGHRRSAIAAGPPTSGPSADDAVGEVHEVFEMFSHDFGVTDDEKPKMAALEKKYADEVRVHPDKLMDKGFQKQVLADVRGILTPEQQKKVDQMETEDKLSRTGMTLKRIGLTIMLWEGDNAQATPPDLGAVVVNAKAGAELCLVYESKTQPPADWAKMDDKAKADWVNKNSDFVYLGGGKKAADEGSDFVVAYIKPEASPDGSNRFLMGDGSVQPKTVEESKAIIAELKAGKNPPPSYKPTPVKMPPPPGEMPKP